MKRTTMLLGVGILFLCSMALATVPHLINFQGVLKDANGQPVADDTYPVKFEIFNSVGPGGGCLWQENQSVATQGGLFSVVLGSASQGGIPDTAFNDSARWLAITVGNDPEISPRQRLVSVGYSYRVGTVDGATGGTIFGNTSIQSDLAVAGAMDAKNLVLKNPGPNGTPLSIQGSAGQTANLMEIKDDAGVPLVNFGPNSSFFKRFALFGHNVSCSESLSVGGHFDATGGAEIGGQDFLVSTGSSQFLNPVGIGTAPSPAFALDIDGPLKVMLHGEQAGTFAHELGHNLGLCHNSPVGGGFKFLECTDALGNPVASIDESGNMTLDGDMDGLNSTWENVQAVDINCNGTFNAAGDVNVGGSLHINSSLSVKVEFLPGCASTTLDESHNVVLVAALGGECFLNLPTAVGIQGRQYTIKAVNPFTGSYNIIPFGGQTIDGNASYILIAVNKYVTIVSDGSNWQIIANN